MRRIHSPSEEGGRRGEQCLLAIEPALVQLVDRAELAGWAPRETIAAIRFLIAEYERQAAGQPLPHVA